MDKHKISTILGHFKPQDVLGCRIVKAPTIILLVWLPGDANNLIKKAIKIVKSKKGAPLLHVRPFTKSPLRHIKKTKITKGFLKKALLMK